MLLGNLEAKKTQAYFQLNKIKTAVPCLLLLITKVCACPSLRVLSTSTHDDVAFWLRSSFLSCHDPSLSLLLLAPHF